MTIRPLTALIAVVLATIAVVVGVTAASPDTHPQPALTTTVAAQTAEPYFVSGALKPDGAGGWYVLDDTAHSPEGGLTVTSVTSTAINVSYTAGAEILSFVVAPDETLAALGWTAGASVGLDHALIYLGRSTGQINPTQVSNTSANLWVLARLVPAAGSTNQVCVPQ